MAVVRADIWAALGQGRVLTVPAGSPRGDAGRRGPVGQRDPVHPPAWSACWTGTITAPSTGAYRFSVSGNGAFRLFINGKLIAHTAYADFATLTQGMADLVAGQPAAITVEYSAVAAIGPSALSIGWSAPDPAMVAHAVRAAKSSDVAVVFANDVTGEGSDRSSLALRVTRISSSRRSRRPTRARLSC